MQVLDYEPVPREEPLPTAVVVVAWLFIAFGMMGVVQMLVGLTQNSCMVRIEILGIFVGRGLLKKAAGWRTVGLIMLWFSIVSMPIVTVAMLLQAGSWGITIFDRRAEGALEIAGATVMMVGIYGLEVWQCWVLMRKDVAAIYRRAAAESALRKLSAFE